MKNVLHTIHVTGPGGAETVCLELARGLDPTGWRSFATVPHAGWIYEPLRDAGIDPLLLATDSRVGYFRGVLEIVRRHDIDLIQAHHLGPAANAGLVGMVAGVPVVSTFHGETDVTLNGGIRDSVRHGIIRRGQHRVVFVSEPLRRSYLDRRLNREERTAVIPNGIDTGLFRPGRDGSFREELGLSEEHIVIGTIANLRPAKDYPSFLRAAALLAAQSPRYRFVAVGDSRGPLLGELTALAAELGLEGKVTFTGFREDTARILASLDVFLLSSRTEGFSLATVQAMASGVPIVATRCGGPESILEDGRTGILVDVGAPDQMMESVRRLLADSALRDRIRSSARREAEDRFSVSGMVRQYERIYREVLGLPSPAVRQGAAA